MDLKGQQWVEIAAMNDKHQMAVVLCGSLSGNLLPFQVIYQGMTSASLPKVDFPKDGMLQLLKTTGQTNTRLRNTLNLPYVCRKKWKELGFPTTFPALVLFDAFKGRPHSPFTNY